MKIRHLILQDTDAELLDDLSVQLELRRCDVIRCGLKLLRDFSKMEAIGYKLGIVKGKKVICEIDSSRLADG